MQYFLFEEDARILSNNSKDFGTQLFIEHRGKHVFLKIFDSFSFVCNHVMIKGFVMLNNFLRTKEAKRCT